MIRQNANKTYGKALHMDPEIFVMIGVNSFKAILISLWKYKSTFDLRKKK